MGVLEVEARIWVLLLYSGFMAGVVRCCGTFMMFYRASQVCWRLKQF